MQYTSEEAQHYITGEIREGLRASDIKPMIGRAPSQGLDYQNFSIPYRLQNGWFLKRTYDDTPWPSDDAVLILS